MTTTFITPPANSSNISAQQQLDPDERELLAHSLGVTRAASRSCE
jgi:hypothetical protein